MKDKIYAKFKQMPEDFVVEEVGRDWVCSVCDCFGKKAEEEIEESDRDFLWCEMVKRELDHFNAMKSVAKSLKKGLHDFGYAGSKDRKAITSQRISIFKPDLELVKNFENEKICLKGYRWQKRKLKLGHLSGNRFNIVLREVDKKEARKVSGISSVTKFKNYFGKQRFGMKGDNYEIGKLILKRDFEGTVWRILSDLSDKFEDVGIAFNRLKKERDFAKAVEYWPGNMRDHISILMHLSKKQGDFAGALRRLPRKILLMYIHSVQSKVFNEILDRVDDDFDGKIMLPGYKLEYSSGEIGKIEKEVMEENGLDFSDFNVEEIRFLRMKGTYRDAFSDVKNLGVDIGDDELNEGMKKIILKFELKSGVYATTFLDNFFDLEE